MEFCLRGNYNHVLAFCQSGPVVQVINPLGSHTEVSLRVHPQGIDYHLDAEFIAMDFTYFGADVVKLVWPVDASLTSHSLTNFFPGCVTMAKGLLGISEWVFTPWQFKQWLSENGGELLTEKRLAELETEWFGRELTQQEHANIFRQLRRNNPHA